MKQVNPRRCIYCGKKLKTAQGARDHERDAGPTCGERAKAERQRFAEREADKAGFADLSDGAYFQAMKDAGFLKGVGFDD